MISFPVWLAMAALKEDEHIIRKRKTIIEVANHIRRLDDAIADIVIPPKD